MATQAPKLSLPGSQFEVVKKVKPNWAIASRASTKTVRKMPRSTNATAEARARVSWRKPVSSSFSDGGRRLRVKTSSGEARLGSVGMQVMTGVRSGLGWPAGGQPGVQIFVQPANILIKSGLKHGAQYFWVSNACWLGQRSPWVE